MSNESRASITESLSEFFDAQEVLLSASSSENEVSVKVSSDTNIIFYTFCLQVVTIQCSLTCLLTSLEATFL